MAAEILFCPKCGRQNPQGARYCAQCGEAIDPALVSELQSLYTTLQAFDRAIANNEGMYTVQALRADYLRRYLALRVSAPATAANASNNPATPSVSTPLSIAPPSAPLPNAALPASLVAPPPAATAPVFSWQRFVAEQSISVMAYLGGFLLLVATLSFEVGAWQQLPDAIKLLAVIGVYCIFAVAGVSLRGFVQLRAVSRVYLGVFALMTPLVALAAYRFELARINFSIPAMVCVSALYAACVYLALATRTRFTTYAYLGWVALSVSALAITPLAGLPRIWWLPTASLLSLILLIPHTLRARKLFPTIAEPLATSALQLAAFCAAVAVIVSLVVGYMLSANQSATDNAQHGFVLAAFAAAACLLVPVMLAWSVTVRTFTTRPTAFHLDALDSSIAFAVALAAIAASAWLHIKRPDVALIFAILALVEMLASSVLRRTLARRVALRYTVEALALTLAAIAPLLFVGGRELSWLYITILVLSASVALLLALTEAAPWWILGTGFFCVPAYETLIVSLIPHVQLSGYVSRPTSDDWLSLPGFDALLTLGVWLLALGVGRIGLARVQRFARPLSAIALGVALYTTAHLLYFSPAFQTAALTLFALLGLLGGWRERQPVVAGLVSGVFGFLLPFPLILSYNNPNANLVIAALMLGASLAALTLRALLGRMYAYVPYGVALLAILCGGVRLSIEQIGVSSPSVLGLPFVAIVLLLAAALAFLVPFIERQPWLMCVPALLVLWTVSVTDNIITVFALTVFALAIGLVLRWRRRHPGDLLWYSSAAACSALAVIRLRSLGADAPGWQIIELLIFAALCYLPALQERQSIWSAGALAYTLAALALLPSPHALSLTVAMVFIPLALGAALRTRLSRPWALTLYGVAVEATCFAPFRVVPYDAGRIEALLLIFAVTAYLIATFERASAFTFVALLYAISAIAFQPDIHALLPLAVSFALAGIAIGRIAGPRWSWPAYAAAAGATLFTIVLGGHNTTFEAAAYALLALIAYLIALIESRPDALPTPFVLSGFALAAFASAQHFEQWQALLAFTLLAWFFFTGRILWLRAPAITTRGPMFWANGFPSLAAVSPWNDARQAGLYIHQWAGLITAGVTCAVAFFTPGSFNPHHPVTEIVVIALSSFAVMLAAHGALAQRRLFLYVAGEIIAVAFSWQARWFGADNIQAFVLAPGSYQIIIGALIPSDRRLGWSERVGQWLTLCGMLILLLPTLAQSFAAAPNWVYASFLALEALALLIVGVGTRSRLLTLTGSVFLGVAVLRGAVIAITSQAPIALVIGALALLLMGGATWLSLRLRRDTFQTPT